MDTETTNEVMGKQMRGRRSGSGGGAVGVRVEDPVIGDCINSGYGLSSVQH